VLEKIKFINHMNEEMVWGQNGIYANYNDLHDYSWSYTSDNNKISSFKKGIVTKTIPIVICCSSANEGVTLKNRLMELAEKDVQTLTHGKIIIGDYYLKCFIIGSTKGKYLIDKGYMEAKLKVVTDYPSWVKESTVSFRKDGSVVGQTPIGGGDGLDYNYDFPFDYTSSMTNKTLNNTGYTETNFKLIIYGAAINPAIHIAGHTYQVNCTIEEGEFLTIDSLEKTITLTKVDGTVENKFNNRNRDSYIFEAIPAGDNSVVWDDDFGFDVILLEERSEPKWT